MGIKWIFGHSGKVGIESLFLQVNLGNMYSSGLGVIKSRQRAKELYRAAADSDSNAKLLLEELEKEKEEKEEGGDGTSKH